MAFLTYVDPDCDEGSCNYVSEPILTFGAASLWYDHLRSVVPLESKILPQFNDLLTKNLTDNGRIGEFVARLVLLLAIDSCTQHVNSNLAFYRGDWYNVVDFLKYLHGDDVRAYRHTGLAYEETSTDLAPFLNCWKGWDVGFSHFHELKIVPTQELLEQLLARRAAGVFPRGQKGADLVIPIKRDTAGSRKISMILIQVKNRLKGDGSFRDSAMHKLRPSFIFKPKKKQPPSPFVQMKHTEVLRIFIDFRGNFSDPGDARFFLRDEDNDGASFVLCLRGYAWWLTQFNSSQRTRSPIQGIAQLPSERGAQGRD